VGYAAPPLGMGVADALETCYSPPVTIPNSVAVRQTIWAYIGSQKISDAGAPHLGIGTWLAPVDLLLPTCITTPNSVILGRTTRA